MSQSLPADASSSLPPQRSAKSDWIGYIVIGLVFLSFLAYRQLRPVPKVGQTHPAIGNKLKEFSVEPLLNVEQPVELAQLKGKITLLNLWGPWCSYCRQEIPHLLEIQDRWKDDLRLVSVSYPQNSGTSPRVLRDETAGTLRLMQKQFPVYQDPEVRVESYLRSAAVFWKLKFPCTILIDRNLAIRGVWLEYRKGFEKEISEIIEQLIAAPQDSPQAPQA